MVGVEQIADWSNPPERAFERGANPRERYVEVVKGLRANKGVWAMLVPRPSERAAKALAGNIEKGRHASFAPRGAFEAVHEGNRVWARYVGEPDGAPPPRPGLTKLNPSSGTVRAWAKATGRKVSDRGRIPDSLVAEWFDATKGRSGAGHDRGAPDAHDPDLG